MARTAVIAGTATATAKVVGGAMDGSKQQKAAAQQQPPHNSNRKRTCRRSRLMRPGNKTLWPRNLLSQRA